MTIDTVGQIVSIVLGGGVVSMILAWRNDQLAQYRQLDDAYTALLQQYRDHSPFGDPARTRRYKDAFKDKDALDYHYFALSVLNMMETLFDILDQHPMDKPQWASIFAHHVCLHQAWLQNNTAMFELDFVEYVQHMVESFPDAKLPLGDAAEVGGFLVGMTPPLRRDPHDRAGL
ncbi:MAG TPA: hypothetical protein VL326_04050 [Kofleriaceae bacterium]|jgi:hypothetical protein|nr:hypothetical protein [Kofleriaceae bacterium]